MLTLLIYLSLGLTPFGCSNMSNTIALSALQVPEIDLSLTLKIIEK